jgi:hypothetical protein
MVFGLSAAVWQLHKSMAQRLVAGDLPPYIRSALIGACQLVQLG